MAEQQVLFVERAPDFWEFCGKTFEDHVDCWQIVDGEVQKDKWKLGAVAASLDTKYNEKTVDRFAHETRRSARRVREYAQTWRAFKNGERSLILSFHHHTVAASAGDPVVAIQKAEDKEWSTRELDKWIKTGVEPGPKPNKEDKLTLTPALQKIHDDAVRAELDGRIAVVRGWTEPVDPILSKVYHRMIEVLEWQRDRTVDRDCSTTLLMFTGRDNEEGVDCASDGDIQVWLKARCFIIAEQELDDRLELMIKVKMIQKRSREGSRGPTQRGSIPDVYEVHPDYLNRMAEADDQGKAPPSAAELLAAIGEVEADNDVSDAA